MRPGRLLAIGILILAPICACAPHAQAQAAASDPRNFDATQFGERIGLGPNWLFTPSDNPVYASPVFDDSAWMTVSTEKDLVNYGVRDIPFAWYRLHIHLRPGTRNLMVGTLYMYGRYEIYANGVRIGGNGAMTRPLFLQQSALFAFAVPDNLLAPRGDLLLAIRVALNRGAQAGSGPSTPLYSGSVHLMSQDSAPREASYQAAHRGAPALFACGLALIVCLISFALYFALADNKEYLAVAILLLAASFAAALTAWQRMQANTFPLTLPCLSLLALRTLLSSSSFVSSCICRARAGSSPSKSSLLSPSFSMLQRSWGSSRPMSTWWGFSLRCSLSKSFSLSCSSGDGCAATAKHCCSCPPSS